MFKTREGIVNVNRTMMRTRTLFNGSSRPQGIFGEFEFTLYGSLKNQIIQLEQLGPLYEEKAMEMMMFHYGFFSQLNKVKGIDPEEYVTREAVIGCTYGTKSILLDAYDDHGVIAANGRPLMTCEDCKMNRNIYSFGVCNYQQQGMEYSHNLPHPKTIGVPDVNGRMRYQCVPVLGKSWVQAEGEVFISGLEGDEFVEALRSGAYLTCLYGGLITVEGLSAEDVLEDKYIIIDDWLYLYYNPTVPNEGRSVTKHKDAFNYDWAMPEELSGNHTKDWFETKSSVYNEIIRNGGNLTVKMTNNNLYTDDEGRFWIAVGPNVMNPNHPQIQVEHDIKSSEMNYGTKIDIVVEGKDGTIYYIPAVVGDAKEHSYPEGVYQTGIPFNKNRPSFPESAGNTVEFIGYNITKIPNGKGGTKSSINITNNYKLIEIIVYDGVFNYEQDETN